MNSKITVLLCLIGIVAANLSILCQASPYNISINGNAFNDLNRNTVFDKDEPGLAEWTILLMKNGTEIGNTTTDSYGRYSFADLTSGYYGLVEMSKDGWSMTSPIGGFHRVIINKSSAENIDFGNIKSQNPQPSSQLSECQACKNGTYIIGSNVSANNSTKFNYAVMRPTLDEVIKELGEYASLPGVTVSPEVMAKVTSTNQLNLLNYLQYTPSDRDQENCGNCWVWAATGICEIALDVQNGIKDRLSIQYLNSNYHGGTGDGYACCGGDLLAFENFYVDKGKMIPWSNQNSQWQDGPANGHPQNCGGSTNRVASTISETPYYVVTSMQVIPIRTRNSDGVSSNDQAITNIKSDLIQGRAVYFSCALPTEQDMDNMGFNTQPETTVWDPSTSNGKTYDETNGGIHAMLVVGYDESDPSNRYWIVLNSWGTAYGLRPNGLIRMKMDMNYNSVYYRQGICLPSFLWQTLDLAFATSSCNIPPDKPSPILGTTKGNPGESYSYTTSASDPCGYPIRYTCDWDDGTTWESSLASGASMLASHSWSNVGTYNVRVKATDINGLTSAWSDSLTVTISQSNVLAVTNDGGASLITSNSARLNGEIINTGGQDPTACFYWGTKDEGATYNWDNCQCLTEVSQGPFSYDVSSLTPGTTYYYRCYASNTAGSNWASSTASFVTQGPSNPIPIYRMWSPSQTDHFYTTDYNEYSTTAVNYGYKQEGILGYIYSNPQPGTIPLYRMFSPSQLDHFYTTDYNEYSTTAVNFGYRQEGILGYMYSSPQPGAIPIYRMWGPANTDHFYTTDYSEYCTTAVGYGYRQEGILGYLATKTDYSSYLGHWKNIDPNTNNIVKIDIAEVGEKIVVHAWGACTPTYCDWGEVDAVDITNALRAFFSWDFKDSDMTLSINDMGYLQASTSNHFKDNSGRSDYTSVDTLVRED